MGCKTGVAELCAAFLDARGERSLLGETEERRRKELRIARALKDALESYLETEEERDAHGQFQGLH